jgi:protein-S-isoprenylcysteine O-methyltransferase Ste14
MKKKLLENARHEYSQNQRILLLLPLAPVFLLLLPYLVVTWGARIDAAAGIAPMLPAPLHLLVAALLALPSGVLAIWSIYAQFTIGRGTPVPVMATQKLIIQPPFSYCRNPMALGTLGMYLGVAVLFRSWGGVVVVLLGAAALLTYIKLVEEKEMAARFGEEYLEYKRQTPFLIPRFWRRR